jgi:uncharacterized protein YutE (UPF0331/DUF86 family)
MRDIKDPISKRLAELIEQGRTIRKFVVHRGYIPKEFVADVQSYLSSTAHIVQLITGGKGVYSYQLRACLKCWDPKEHITLEVFSKTLGILEALTKDWEAGLLTEIKYLIAAKDFDSFLDHASEYHKSGKKKEAAVLISAVLEDTLGKLAEKHNIEHPGNLSPFVDLLKSKGILKPVRARRIKNLVDFRNSAFHARWEEFDLKDVAKAIEDTRELLDMLEA